MWGIANRIRRHLADPESQHRKIAQGFLWVSLFVFLGKLAGAAKEITIAWRYGVSETVDAYVFVFNLVSWPVSIWFSILTAVLVPLAARLQSESPLELPRFRAELLGLTLSLGLGLGLLTWLALPPLLRSSWLGLSEGVVTEALRMTSGLALLVPLGFVISLLSTWLLAAGRHRNTLFEAIPAFIVMMLVLVPSGAIPEPLLWGTIAGFALHMTALGITLHKRGEVTFPAFARKSLIWRSFWGSISIMALGQVLMGITTLVDQFFAAGLDSGALSTLNYANRILALVLGLGATAISRATLPVFSQAQSQNAVGARGVAINWAVVMFLTGCGVLILGWVGCSWLVTLLFERGAFSSSDTEAVTAVLRVLLFQLPFYFSGLVLVSVLVSQGKLSWIVFAAAIALFVKVIFLFCSRGGVNLQAIALSACFAYAASMAVCLVALRRA